MKYNELIQFDPVDQAVRLSDADQEGGARRLVSSFLISPEMAAHLTGQIFPALQFERPADARMLLVTGPRGVGKTHLLAAVSALAERAAIVEHLIHRKSVGVTIAGRVDGLASVEEMAGRFRVLRLSLDQVPATSLRVHVLGQLETFLAAEGVDYRFPDTSRKQRHRPAFDDMMVAFHAKHADKGLLLVIDELLELLKTRKAADLLADLDFLRELAGAGQNLKFRVIAASQQSPFEQSSPGVAESGLRRLQPHCLPILLGGRNAAFVAAHRMVRKTPEQRARIEAHLTRFAPFYSGMQERMHEFVDAFPLHPDYAVLFEKDVFAERRGALRLLSDVVAKRLEQELPEDRPGLFAYDFYWEVMRPNPMCRKVPEIAAVLDFSALLEERVAKAIPEPADRAMALRIIHALSIQRLASGDVYNWHGATPAELRDMLCLFQPGLVIPEGRTPAEALLEHVGKLLEALRKGVNGPRVTVRVHEHQYHLHFRKFRRFHYAELILHWVNAVPFLLLMGSGALMLYSRFSHLDREMFTRTVALHKVCALIWICAMPLTVVSHLRVHWANIRVMLTWGVQDAVWMVQSVRALINRKVVIPPADRFNTGQKINACLVMIYYVGFGITGAFMYWKASALIPWYVHAAMFFSALGSVGGHLFLALVNPSTRIALGGIFHGWAPMKYVEHHHALSIPKARREHAKPLSVRALAAEILYSRIELSILLATLLLGGVGAYAFGQGRLATAKKQFAKSFADVIQPSELSTKHRIGPVSESCTKCHLYTGEIPDRKCEACHEDIQQRRIDKAGYHGTLKGDCRYCHREHRERSATLVPLDREKFSHEDALFKLAGKHAKVECDECHKKQRTEKTPGIYYIGLPHERCTDCHRDRHDGQFVRKTCDTCHTPRGWTGKEVKFSHKTDSDYPLEGRHAAVDCAKCHKPTGPKEPLGSAKFKGLGRACVDCHEEPHRKQFETRCTDCHSTAGWDRKNLDFDHAKDAKFPLLAKHADVACDKCHQPQQPGDPLGKAQFRGLPFGKCSDCHKDPHAGQFVQDCTQCHPRPDTWKVSAPQFEHNRDTKFTLVGKHVPLACVTCHKPVPEGGKLASAKFKGLDTTCEKCHEVKHPASYGTVCTACHAPDAWPKKRVTFDHGRDFRFELVGKHLLAKCSACHDGKLMGAIDRGKPVAYSCRTCHQKDDPHKGVLGEACAKCHSTRGWKGEDLVFDHDTMSRFKIDRDHVKVACVDCHKNGKWKPLDTACSSCHTKFFLDQKRDAR